VLFRSEDASSTETGGGIQVLAGPLDTKQG